MRCLCFQAANQNQIKTQRLLKYTDTNYQKSEGISDAKYSWKLSLK